MKALTTAPAPPAGVVPVRRLPAEPIANEEVVAVTVALRAAPRVALAGQEDEVEVLPALISAFTTCIVEIRIDRAPTRWGRVSFQLIRAGSHLSAKVKLERAGAPAKLHVKLRSAAKIRAVTMNGEPAPLIGETVVVQTGTQRAFELVGQTWGRESITWTSRHSSIAARMRIFNSFNECACV